MSNDGDHSNGWGEWKRHILYELERIAKCLEHLEENQSKIQDDITSLKVKSGIWGAFGVCIGAIGAAIINMYVKS